MNKRLVGIGILGFGLVVGIIAFASSLERVPAGYAGVVYSLNGGVSGEVLGQGMHLLSPIKHVSKYPVSTETMYLSKDSVEGSKGDDSFFISTKDGKMVSVDVELSYHYDIEMVDKVYTKWRGKKPSEIEDTYIRARIKSLSNEITSNYGVLDVYGEKRTELNNAVFVKLRDMLGSDGIILETFNFTRIEPDAETQVAIQSRVNEHQKLEQSRIEAERTKVEAQKQLISAQADADAKKIQAQGDADSRMIQAEAEKNANNLISQSLDEKVLRLKELQKWNGALPTVQSGDSTPIIKIGGTN